MYQNKNKLILKKSELLLKKAEQAQATKYLCIFPKKRLFKYRKKNTKATQATTILH